MSGIRIMRTHKIKLEKGALAHSPPISQKPGEKKNKCFPDNDMIKTCFQLWHVEEWCPTGKNVKGGSYVT